MSKLKRLQDLIFNAITKKDGIENAAGIIEDSVGISAPERLEIYRSAYRIRLSDCLKKDFSASGEILGWDKFNGLIEKFIANNFSNSPNINEFSRQWPEFWKANIQEPLLCDLVNFELKMLESFYRHIQSGDKNLYGQITISQNPHHTIRLDNSVMLSQSNWPLVQIHSDRKTYPPATEYSMIWTCKSIINREAISQAEYLLIVLFKEKSSLEGILDSLSFIPDPQETAAFLQETIAKLLQKRVLVGC